MIPSGKEPFNESEREIERLVSSAQVEGETDPASGHRDWPRFAVGMQLDVTSDPKTPASAWPVTMQNISEGGFAFWSKRQVRIGGSLWVREFSADNSKPWIEADVTHCTTGIRGFLIGAKFRVVTHHS